MMTRKQWMVCNIVSLLLLFQLFINSITFLVRNYLKLKIVYTFEREQNEARTYQLDFMMCLWLNDYPLQKEKRPHFFFCIRNIPKWNGECSLKCSFYSSNKPNLFSSIIRPNLRTSLQCFFLCLTNVRTNVCNICVFSARPLFNVAETHVKLCAAIIQIHYPNKTQKFIFIFNYSILIKQSKFMYKIFFVCWFWELMLLTVFCIFCAVLGGLIEQEKRNIKWKS